MRPTADRRPVRRFSPLLMIAAGINLVVGLASLALLVLLVAALGLGTLLTGDSKFGNDNPSTMAVLGAIGLAGVVGGGTLIAQSAFQAVASAKPVASMVIAAALDGVIIALSALWSADRFVDHASTLGPALAICGCGSAAVLVVIASGVD
jgi:hypothetical protein